MAQDLSPNNLSDAFAQSVAGLSKENIERSQVSLVPHAPEENISTKLKLETRDKNAPQSDFKGTIIPDSAFVKSAKLASEYTSKSLAIQKLHDKYASLEGNNRQNKISALKDMNLNPYQMKDPYDSLTNSLQRWKNMLPQAKGLSQQQKDTAAGNYYDKMIAPFYAKMGATPPSKEDWIKNAYTTMQKWDMDSAYQSHWRQGLYGGYRDWENIIGTATNIYGAASASFAKLMQGPAAHPDLFKNMIKDVKTKGIYGTIEKEAGQIPILGSTIKSVQRASSVDQFWHDINPNQHWYQSLGSFVSEQAMMLPLYKAMGQFNENGIAAMKESNLTKTLMGTKIGRLSASLLMNGAEGLAYGYTMRNDADKRNAWQDGIGQAILGTIFHVAGERLSLKSIAKGDIAKSIEDEETKIELGKHDLKEGDEDSLYDDMVKTTAGNLAAGGRNLQSSIYREAFNHIIATEGASKDYIRSLIAHDIKSDGARFKPIYEAAAYIRKLLGKRSLKELSPEEMSDLVGKLNQLTNRAAEQAPGLLPEMQQAEEKSVAKKVVGNKDAGTAIAKIKADFAKQRQDHGLPPWDDEKLQKAAEAEYAEKNAKAGAKAVNKKSSKPIEQALDIVDRDKKVAKRIKVHSKYTTNKYGEPGVQYSLNAEWKAYAKRAVKAAGLEWTNNDIKKWLDGLDHQDFVDDLYQYFYPKDLKTAKIHFESGHISGGAENPNFLAFMYNYADQMPKQFAERLSQELEDTNKVEKWLDPKIDTETQKMHYAKGMWNHVSDFVQSGRYLKEGKQGLLGNIYRSTYEDIKNPTIWQKMLHREVIESEENMIHEIFAKDPEAESRAMTAYRALMKTRLKAFTEGSQGVRKEAQLGIDEILKQTGEYQSWRF